MNTKTKHLNLIHKICATILLFCFGYILLAQALHTHESHNHCNKHTKYQVEQNFNEVSNEKCQICEFTINIKQNQLLPSILYFNFEQLNFIQTSNYKYVAFFTSKHISLFSGNSPPSSLAFY